MKALRTTVLISILLFCANVYAGIPPTICTEADGNPRGVCNVLKFANGNLTLSGTNATVADQTGAGGGDEISVNSAAATSANFLDNIYMDWALDTGASPDDITSKFNYNAASGDVGLAANEVAWSLNGLVSEGTTANTIEGRFAFPDWASPDKVITFQDATHTVVGRDTTDTLTNKTLAAADNVIGADTAVALAADGANCVAGNYPLGVDASGAVQSCTADDDVPDAADYSNLTGGAGIVHNPTGTLATASSETDFFASGALTCGAGTRGRAQVHTTPFQYCDNAATPTLQYAAYGASNGDALSGDSATGFFSGGELESTRGGTGVDSTLSTGVARVSLGMWTFDAGIVHLAASTSAELADVLSDETGSGLSVFNINPLFVGARFGNGATSGGFLDFVEDTDNGTNRIRFTAPSAITSDQECILENDGNPIPDSCVGDGTDAGAGSGPSHWQIHLLPESAVLDDNSSPAITTIESTGTGTPRFRVADFDATTDEIIYWSFTAPSDTAAGDWLADVSWFSNSTTAGHTVVWEAALSCTTEADADTLIEQATGTTNTASEDVNTTEANRLIQTRITMSNLDSVAAGDACTLRFNRDANNASDDSTADARLPLVLLRPPRA